MDSFSASLRETAVGLIDSETDPVTFVRETRCGGFSTSVLAANGDLYFASDPYVGALHRVGGDAVSPPGCVLRMLAGKAEFDPSYYADITALVPGFGGGVIKGLGSAGYIRVYDESVMPIAKDTTALDLYGYAAWRFHRVELGASTPAIQTDLPPARARCAGSRWMA